jgi:excisionase family DNA binding protein
MKMATAKQAAETIGVNVSTVYRWIKMGVVRATRRGRRWDVDLDSLPRKTAKPQELDARILDVYAKLASYPGAFVSLARVRAALSDVDEHTLDAALLLLGRNESLNVTFVPENNQKSLTSAQRAAALLQGAQYKHLMSVS